MGEPIDSLDPLRSHTRKWRCTPVTSMARCEFCYANRDDLSVSHSMTCGTGLILVRLTGALCLYSVCIICICSQKSTHGPIADCLLTLFASVSSSVAVLLQCDLLLRVCADVPTTLPDEENKLICTTQQEIFDTSLIDWILLSKKKHSQLGLRNLRVQ